jgi:hypothetical protein
MIFSDNLQFIRNATRVRTKTRNIQTNLFCNICIYQAKMPVTYSLKFLYSFCSKQFAIFYCDEHQRTSGGGKSHHRNSSRLGDVAEELCKNDMMNWCTGCHRNGVSDKK